LSLVSRLLMRFASCLLAFLLVAGDCLPARCQLLEPAGPSAADSRPEANKPENGGSAPETGGQPPADPFDFSGKRKTAGVEKERYLVLDESIKVRVAPVERSSVVDRVLERSTIYVRAPGSVRVEVYLEPVDSPYCGRSIGLPKLLGQSSDARRNFPVIWASAEPYRYVKIYALAYKSGGLKFGRSRSVDLAMSGLRFAPPPARGPGR
jgi:hypothetical protein